jgi:ABC-type lipoprotein export system ATPase subunit
LLTLDGVEFGYRGVAPLFCNVSVEVLGGTSLAILGPSGSGKSTLLGLIGGALAPTSGTTRLDGAARTAEYAALNTAWIPQSLNLLRRRSVLDNATAIAKVDEPPSLWPAISERAKGVLEKLSMGNLTDAPARQLSGGEAQRTCVARALVSSRRLILADEPTGQLDQHMTDIVAAMLTSDVPPARVVIVVTHDRSVAQRCDQILELLGTQ